MRPSFQSDQLSPEEKEQVHRAMSAVEVDCESTDPISASYSTLVSELGTELCERSGIYVLPDGFKLSVIIPVFNEAKTL